MPLAYAVKDRLRCARATNGMQYNEILSEKKVEPITEKKISRRSMLKWTGALAAAVVVGVGAGYETNQLLRPITEFTQTATETVESKEEQLFVNCGHMGPITVAVKNGRIVRVDPFMTPNWKTVPTYTINARGKTFTPTINKSLMSAWHQAARRYVYSSDRLLYPMKRVGYTPGGKGDVSNRGRAEFVRMSWDEATNLIATEMERLRTTSGFGSIMIGGIY